MPKKLPFSLPSRAQATEQAVATLLLLGAAFFNGYPLVFSDTGTYITCGFEWLVPVDRPISYGLFLRATGLGFSLWLPVIVQCFLLAWLLRLLWYSIFPGKKDTASLPFLMLTGFLCVFSPVAWYSGELMPDVFSAILLLIVPVVFLRENLTRWKWVALGALFVFCTVAHFSNLFTGVFTLLAIALLRRFGVQALQGLPRFRRKTLVIVFWCLAAYLTMPLINEAFDGEWTMGKGSYTFLIGRLLDNGVLQRYLDENCGHANFRLCQYKDSLPVNSRRFHWDPDSPLAKEGGWGVPEPEYKAIVWNTLTTPKYLVLHIWESLLATPSQLLQNSVGSGMELKWYSSPESPPYQAVAKYYPYELNEYRFSRQCGNMWGQGLDLDFYSTLFFWALLLSAFLLPVLLYQNTSQPFLPPALECACYFLLCAMLSNAFVTSSLASVCDRFQSRVSWFLPFAVGMMCWSYWQNRIKAQKET
ncbi:MAG: hypothetical protein KDC61_09500 [Saprospiraceae bacterium]|nr:hypothetical protein [Saprospiraceae bacterium]MCB9356186.1 hypothetical protein [Lewinellaceae bacterium]